MISHALNAHGGSGRIDAESETFVSELAPCLTQNYGKQPDNSDTSAGPMLIAHSLRADGFDASEDGTGRGTPIIADTVRSHPRPGSNSMGNCIPILEVGKGSSSRGAGPNGMGIGQQGDPMYTLQAGAQHALAFTERGRDQGRTFESQEDLAYALCNPGSGGRTHSRQVFTPQMAVRRLTPKECERLQGFPDDYTQVQHRGKPAADGPRYKALGNSMAVPVLTWIGERILQAWKPSGNDVPTPEAQPASRVAIS